MEAHSQQKHRPNAGSARAGKADHVTMWTLSCFHVNADESEDDGFLWIGLLAVHAGWRRV